MPGILLIQQAYATSADPHWTSERLPGRLSGGPHANCAMSARVGGGREREGYSPTLADPTRGLADFCISKKGDPLTNGLGHSITYEHGIKEVKVPSDPIRLVTHKDWWQSAGA